jgi:hypothetical protein
MNYKNRIRRTFNNYYDFRVRITTREIDQSVMNKSLFLSVIKQLKEIEDRRDFMQEEIGLDMTTYEDKFFSVIENLMKMHFTKEQLALIQMYLYQLVPDKEWDGTITIENNKKEEVVKFKTPEDVWEVIEKFS